MGVVKDFEFGDPEMENPINEYSVVRQDRT